MRISDTEKMLRLKAVHSTVASAKMAGLQPSELLESLFAQWVEGEASLDEVHSTISAKVTSSHD
jgi:Antitoxin VbhA